MRPKVILSFLGLLIFVLSLRLMFFFITGHKYVAGERVGKEVIIFSEPKSYFGKQRLSIVLDSGQSVIVTLPQDPVLSYGDTISIGGVLKNKNVGTKSILALDYPRITVKKSSQNLLLAVLARVRYVIASFYDLNLPQTSSSLLLGIVYGIKADIPSDFSNLLKNTGVTHVIAASGMNITLIAGFFAVFFGRFLKRKVAIFLTILAIFTYALLSGLSPSIMRASIMGTIAFSSQLAGRQNASVLALFFTVVIMLLLSPILLLDIGFQLSALSTLGILIFNPILEARTKNIEFIKFLGADFFTTISAQLFTFPIIIANFGTYSFISVLVNLLVLWTIPILMVLGALSSLLAFLFEPLAVLVLYLSYPFLIYFESVVRSLGNLGLSFTLSTFPWELGLGYYLLLIAFVIKIKK